jgi:hypothetical protein
MSALGGSLRKKFINQDSILLINLAVTVQEENSNAFFIPPNGAF